MPYTSGQMRLEVPLVKVAVRWRLIEHAEPLTVQLASPSIGVTVTDQEVPEERPLSVKVRL